MPAAPTPGEPPARDAAGGAIDADASRQDPNLSTRLRSSAHVRNSPAAFVHKLNTPMLMMFGDDDGTVDWRQGVEFYNYARRAGKKDFVLLVYPGEDHGLRQKQNQIDYQRRILQWFGHYLKGEDAPAWITDG